jgi:hypothetical protein
MGRSEKFLIAVILLGLVIFFWTKCIHVEPAKIALLNWYLAIVIKPKKSLNPFDNATPKY